MALLVLISLLVRATPWRRSMAAPRWRRRAEGSLAPCATTLTYHRIMVSARRAATSRRLMRFVRACAGVVAVRSFIRPGRPDKEDPEAENEHAARPAHGVGVDEGSVESDKLGVPILCLTVQRLDPRRDLLWTQHIRIYSVHAPQPCMHARLAFGSCN
jgi:hypothetical protein